MGRSADYTIQGFIYQFNKTLLEILNDQDDSEITIEGITEDIEIVTPLITKAIQCKYHEAQETFTISNVYKPILQMMDHYRENITSKIKYKIYAHFPNEVSGTEFKLNKEIISQIFQSTDKTLLDLITKVNGTINLDDFIERFTLEFGLSLSDLIISVQQALIENSMSKEEIETLIYPNAVQIIAELSILHDSTLRIIKKTELLEKLRNIRKTAVSRWTRMLKTLDIILKTRKKQLKTNLGKNSRLRYFLVSEDSILNFNDEIVTFITEYLSKYHFKEVHDKTPLFCLDCKHETFRDIRIRLHKKNINYNDGLVTDDFFDKNKFLLEPFRTSGKHQYIAYLLRLQVYSEDIVQILNENKCDDFYVFMKDIPINLDFQDINVEHIDLNEINQIKFILGMCDSYE